MNLGHIRNLREGEIRGLLKLFGDPPNLAYQEGKHSVVHKQLLGDGGVLDYPTSGFGEFVT